MSRFEYFKPDPNWTPTLAAKTLRSIAPAGTIPWERFSEDELQSLLTFHYKWLGYDVRNLHKDDRSREHGTDLLCSKKTLNKTIAIAVKVNPGKDDLYQLKEFSESPYEERHYVYTGRLARSFLDQSEKTVGVDFIDEKGLERLFQNSGTYYLLRIENSRFFESFGELMWNLLQLTFYVERMGRKAEPFPKLTLPLLERLWSLKDRAVTVSRGAEVLMDSFDYERLTKAKLDPTALLSIVEAGLDTLYSEGMTRLLRLLDEKTLDLVGLDYLHSGTASPWLVVSVYQFYLQPGRVDTFLKKEFKNSEGGIEVWKGNDDFYSMLYRELRTIYHATADIETLVDDMFTLAKPFMPTSDTALEELQGFVVSDPDADEDK